MICIFVYHLSSPIAIHGRDRFMWSSFHNSSMTSRHRSSNHLAFPLTSLNNVAIQSKWSKTLPLPWYRPAYTHKLASRMHISCNIIVLNLRVWNRPRNRAEYQHSCTELFSVILRCYVYACRPNDMPQHWWTEIVFCLNRAPTQLSSTMSDVVELCSISSWWVVVDEAELLPS